jgi:hypothetical protein
MTPAPLVPEMPTPTTEAPQQTADSGAERRAEPRRRTTRADGGERRTLPERTVGAPLVPDCR